MTRGPWILVGPSEGPWYLGGPWAGRGPREGPIGFIGPIEMKHRRSFFLGDHLNLVRKTASIWVKTFFFWRSLENSEKSVPFSLPVLDYTKPEMRNIWVVPGPTLGAPARIPQRPTVIWVRDERSYIFGSVPCSKSYFYFKNERKLIIVGFWTWLTGSDHKYADIIDSLLNKVQADA